MKDKELPSDKTICSRHNLIISLVSDIIIATNDKTILRLCDCIIHETQLAMKSGEHMEERLEEYKNAIKSLGFERRYEDDTLNN